MRLEQRWRNDSYLAGITMEKMEKGRQWWDSFGDDLEKSFTGFLWSFPNSNLAKVLHSCSMNNFRCHTTFESLYLSTKGYIAVMSYILTQQISIYGVLIVLVYCSVSWPLKAKRYLLVTGCICLRVFLCFLSWKSPHDSSDSSYNFSCHERLETTGI